MLNPNREFDWDFYERLGQFRDFLKALRTSSLYDNYKKAFLSEISSSIPEGDLNKELSYDQVLPYALSEEERKELLGKLTDHLVENGLDASWLNELPLRNIYVRNTLLKFSKNKVYLEIPRALYAKEPSTTTSGKDLMERKATQSIRKKEWPFFCMNSGIAGNPRLPNGWSDIKTRTFQLKRMPS